MSVYQLLAESNAEGIWKRDEPFSSFQLRHYEPLVAFEIHADCPRRLSVRRDLYAG